MRRYAFALLALALGLVPQIALGQELEDQLSTRAIQEKRGYDTYQVFSRKRNAHACIMSIVFIVLFPLGAISIHLPIDRIPFLKNTYLKKKVMAIHAPIQLLGLVMMIGGMSLGIKIAHDLNYFMRPVPAHMIIGLVVVCTIIVFQPILGTLQHAHYKKTGGKSIYAYVHRWIGRGAIVLGAINNGLGLQLASKDIIIPAKTYIRNFVILGAFVLIWVGLVAYDHFRSKRAPRTDERGEGAEKGLMQNGTESHNPTTTPQA